MYIIIGHGNVVMDWAENLTYMENGNPCVNETLAYDKSIVKNVLEVETVPADIERDKYNYTLSNGFVRNETWVDPNLAVDPKILVEKIQQLESDLGNVLFESAADKAKIAELETAQGDLLMEVAMLKTGGNV